MGRLRTGLAELFSLPEGYEVVLGNGGTTAFWDIATFGLIRDRAQFASVRRVRRQVRQGGQGRAVPRRPDRHQGRPGHRAGALAPRPASTSYATPAQRDVDRRGHPGHAGSPAPTRARCMLTTRPPAPAGSTSTSAQTDVYYFAPQKCFASDGGLWIALMSPGRDRPHRGDQGVRPLDPRVPRPGHGGRAARGSTRRTTPRRWPRSS